MIAKALLRSLPSRGLKLAGVWFEDLPLSPTALFFAAKSLNSGNGAEETLYKFRNAAKRPVICNRLLSSATLTMNDVRLVYAPPMHDKNESGHVEEQDDGGFTNSYHDLMLACVCDFNQCFSAVEYSDYLRLPDNRKLPDDGVLAALPPPSLNASFASFASAPCWRDRLSPSTPAAVVMQLLEAGGITVVLVRNSLDVFCNFYIGMYPSQGMALDVDEREVGTLLKRAARGFTRASFDELDYGQLTWARAQGPGMATEEGSARRLKCEEPDGHAPVSRAGCDAQAAASRGLVWLQVRSRDEQWGWNPRTGGEGLEMLLGEFLQ